jgi:hypothetical protein
MHLRFTHFLAPPGFSYTLTADPWSLLHLTAREREAHTKGVNRRTWRACGAYLKLAEGFYIASENAALPTKPLLIYYGMLNLVKAFVSATTTCELGISGVREYHGVVLDGPQKVRVTTSAKSKTINIFDKFADCLGFTVTGMSLLFDEIAPHIPEIHEVTTSVLSSAGKRRDFVPVEIKLLMTDPILKQKSTHIWSVIYYEKKEETRINNLQARFHSGWRRGYFKAPVEASDCIHFESEKRKQFKLTEQSAATVFSNICREYEECCLASILSPSGYKYYVDLADPHYPSICYTFLLMFYLGSVARYRPLELEELLVSNRGPIVSEALRLSPKQFLYQIAGLITNSVCVIPFAAI